MTQATRPALPPALQALYGVAILVCAPFVLFPAVRALPYGKLVIGLAVAVLFVVGLRQASQRDDLNRSLQQIHEQAKAGRRVAGLALQTAATVAALLAMWFTY